jgi:Zn ribbon nucleic-acid-binding protein
MASLKSKLPDCPRCDDDELYVQTDDNVLIVKCYNCGWSGEIKLPIAVDALSKQVTEMVAEAKARIEAARAGKP